MPGPDVPGDDWVTAAACKQIATTASDFRGDAVIYIQLQFFSKPAGRLELGALRCPPCLRPSFE